jgi:hypothetical protein
MTPKKNPSSDSPDQLPNTTKARAVITLAAILLFTLVFFVLRYLGFIDELPLKMGVFEGLFK